MKISLPRGKGRLTFDIVHHGRDVAHNPEGNWSILPATYASGKVVVQCPGYQGLKTRAARLAGAKGIGGRYSNRSRGYVMSPAAAERFARLFFAGWDAGIFGDLQPPEQEGTR